MTIRATALLVASFAALCCATTCDSGDQPAFVHGQTDDHSRSRLPRRGHDIVASRTAFVRSPSLLQTSTDFLWHEPFIPPAPASPPLLQTSTDDLWQEPFVLPVPATPSLLQTSTGDLWQEPFVPPVPATPPLLQTSTDFLWQQPFVPPVPATMLQMPARIAPRMLPPTAMLRLPVPPMLAAAPLASVSTGIGPKIPQLALFQGPPPGALVDEVRAVLQNATLASQAKFNALQDATLASQAKLNAMQNASHVAHLASEAQLQALRNASLVSEATFRAKYQALQREKEESERAGNLKVQELQAKLSVAEALNAKQAVAAGEHEEDDKAVMIAAQKAAATLLEFNRTQEGDKQMTEAKLQQFAWNQEEEERLGKLRLAEAADKLAAAKKTEQKVKVVAKQAEKMKSLAEQAMEEAMRVTTQATETELQASITERQVQMLTNETRSVLLQVDNAISQDDQMAKMLYASEMKMMGAAHVAAGLHDAA